MAFQKFKALRNTQLALGPFNLVIGPNGSGKTSLIQALLRLRELAASATGADQMDAPKRPAGPQITFEFNEPFAELQAQLACVSDQVCDLLKVGPPEPTNWPRLCERIQAIRTFTFDPAAMVRAIPKAETLDLTTNAGNLGSVLATLQERHPDDFELLEAELVRMMPEYAALVLLEPEPGTVEIALSLQGESSIIPAENLSQGTLSLLGMLALAFHPVPPSVVCIEEIDRGIHPRWLREVRDTLYRLSYPEPSSSREPVQVIATTHSPYLLDLFREHPEEVVISQKQGNAATFQRLSDRDDLDSLLAEGSLGDIWFSGILGGVPDEA